MIVEYIKGQNRRQITLLPDCLDDYVSPDNAVRVIDAYVDSLDFLKLGFDRATPNGTGRPMYAPSDLLKLYVYGYMNRIRSSRRLETETTRNLEVIWLLKKLSPDHKTISRFRHDNTAALKNMFRDFVKLCMKWNLYGKELIAIDGSKFKAVNSKDRNFGSKKLEERISRIDARIEEYLRELEDSDTIENVANGERSSEELAQIITELAARKDLYQSYANELNKTGTLQKSLTDPDSRLMMANGRLDVCYNIQSAVDSKNKMVVEFTVTNNAVDKNQLAPMAANVRSALETQNISLVADVGYDSVQDIVRCMENDFSPHVAGTNFDICIPTANRQENVIASHKNGRCVYYAERNIALCPMGEILYPGFYKTAKGHGVFHNFKACKHCSCKCGKETRGRRYEVPMKASDFSKTYDDNNLFMKQVRISPDKNVIRQRKSIVEHPFGILKRNMDSGYCLTKGIEPVTGEFSLAFLAFNMKRAINILGTGKILNELRA